MPTRVDVHFDTEAENKFLRHTTGEVPLDPAGRGSFQAKDDESDLIVFGMEGDPGTTATITLTVPAPAQLEIAGHPIQGTIAQNRRVWGSSRFFTVRV
jgi:hypothetical protein